MSFLLIFPVLFLPLLVTVAREDTDLTIAGGGRACKCVEGPGGGADEPTGRMPFEVFCETPPESFGGFEI